MKTPRPQGCSPWGESPLFNLGLGRCPCGPREGRSTQRPPVFLAAVTPRLLFHPVLSFPVVRAAAPPDATAPGALVTRRSAKGEGSLCHLAQSVALCPLACVSQAFLTTRRAGTSCTSPTDLRCTSASGVVASSASSALRRPSYPATYHVKRLCGASPSLPSPPLPPSPFQRSGLPSHLRLKIPLELHPQ